MRSERGLLAGLQIELPQLDSVVLVASEYNMSTIMRPIRLVVVAPRVGEFARLVTTDDLAPKRTTHTVDQLLAIGRKCQRRWAAGQLGQIHFTVVIIVRQLNLRSHGLALSQDRQGREYQKASQEDPVLTPGHSIIESLLRSGRP